MDQFYYESGYIEDGYYTYIAEAVGEVSSAFDIIATPQVIRSAQVQLIMDSNMIVTAGATSRLTIVPGVYSSTAGKLQYGAFYIDAGPEVTV